MPLGHLLIPLSICGCRMCRILSAGSQDLEPPLVCLTEGHRTRSHFLVHAVVAVTLVLSLKDHAARLAPLRHGEFRLRLLDRRAGEASAAVRARVETERQVQAERFAGSEFHTNADMGPGEVQQFVRLDTAGEQLMAAVRQLALSARAYHRGAEALPDDRGPR